LGCLKEIIDGIIEKTKQGGKMLSIQGIYKNGKIKLLEHMPKRGRFWRDYYPILMKMIPTIFWNVTIREGKTGLRKEALNYERVYIECATGRKKWREKRWGFNYIFLIL